MEIIHEKQRKKHGFVLFLFQLLKYQLLEGRLAETKLPGKQIPKLKVVSHSTNYKNILFQDPNVEIVGEHFDREKGKEVEVDETILPFYATLWPETVFNSRSKSKISSQFVLVFDKLES